jgi:negative regulator of sigma E activity
VKDEVESQLSAMYDGELPAAECELLSRRIDREDRLRARWARYVLIGASMRFEPVATASAGFAARVSAAVAGIDTVVDPKLSDSPPRERPRSSKLVWQSALAATLVVAVAGLSIAMLRNVTLNGAAGTLSALSAQGATPERPASVRPVSTAPSALTPETWSYVTPAASQHPGLIMPLRSEFADYIVAHSEYSVPLIRPDVLSALVSAEQGLDEASSDKAPSLGMAIRPGPGTSEVDAPADASRAR